MEILMPQDKIIEEIKINSAIRDRRIFLCEEIDRDSVFKVIYWLDRLKTLDKKNNTKESIEIVLDSYGGDAYSTIALCSKIKSMINDGYKIITTVHTVAFSGGFWLLICGNERRALPDSRIMVHNAISETSGKHQDMIDDMEETNSIWKKLKSIVINNTNITDERLEEIKKLKYDWYFWGSEAVQDNLKIVDYLI
jgi:ATP-dependent protease ClpP protease subunit